MKMTTGSNTRNEWKNESLYIGLKDDNFKTPSEMITPEKAERTIALSIFAFEDAKRYISSCGKLTERKPEDAKQIFKHFNPDTLDARDAMELMKTIAKLMHSKTKPQ